MPPVKTEKRQYVGHSVARREGRPKVMGQAVYVDDLNVPGALYGKTLRSTIARGRIRKIHFPDDIPWKEFVVATAADLPNNFVALIKNDQPALADREIRHHQEAILLIAHADRGLVEKAIRSIKVEYDEEPAVLDMREGERMQRYLIEHGDLEKEFAASDIVFERTYRTGAQEHVYIEPQGFIAYWDEQGVTLHGSHQCPYYVHRSVCEAFGLAGDQVNVIQETTGGAFGGKEDFPSQVAIHAALLAKKAGRPVRLMYDRQEDMACSTKRHPSETTVRIGCMRDGRVRALDFRFLLDGGAYVTLTPVVLSRGILHGCGPYNWPAARLEGIANYTNSPPYGAFRGFGTPQSIFAIELHMNMLAEKFGMDPVELRRKNFLHKGDAMPTGQVMDQDPRMDELLDRALELSDFERKAKAYRRGEGRGIALSAFMHGTGFTGSGEVYLASKVALSTRADGKVEILVASTEMGQGTETVFPQIAAEALGIPVNDVVFHKPETRAVPNSGPTVASRTVSIVGRLVQRAGEDLREKLNGYTVVDHVKHFGTTRAEADFVPPPDLVWDDETYKGSAYGAYSWSVDVAEVSLDRVTMMPTVESVWSIVDVGTVINPVLAAGQVEGGVAQAVGWATMENVVLGEGRMTNCQMTNYIIPTTMDAPDIYVEFLPTPWDEGCYGAKGLGELPMDGPAPAVVAAINHAANTTLTHIPAQPEDLLV